VNVKTDPIDVIATGSAAFDFEAVFLAHYARIARVVARVVKDRARAEDIAVEVFWKLWQTPRAQGANVNGWLYRVATRMALDELRKQTRREKYEHLLVLSRRAPTPEQLHSDLEEQQRVRNVLASMKRSQSQLLVLRSEGLDYQDIARTLQLNPGSVGTLLSRAQQAFRKEYVKRYGQRH
jgi:RNA polymerase sigma-70 factor (ECF subfamily)